MSTTDNKMSQELTLHELASLGDQGLLIQKPKYVVRKIIDNIRAGANLCAQDSAGRTPLHIAIINNCLDLVPIFASDPEVFKVQDKKGNAPIHTAIWEKITSNALQTIVKNMVLMEEDVSAEPLKFYQLQMINGLVLEAADLNLKNSKGMTPLHLAVLKNDLDIMTRLLQLDADPCIQDTVTLQSALHLAIESEYYDLADRLLLSDKTRHHIDLQTKKGSTALHIAAKKAAQDVQSSNAAKRAAKSGQSADAVKKAGEKSKREAHEIVKLLLKHKANPHIKNEQGQTPSDIFSEITTMLSSVKITTLKDCKANSEQRTLAQNNQKNVPETNLPAEKVDIQDQKHKSELSQKTDYIQPSLRDHFQNIIKGLIKLEQCKTPQQVGAPKSADIAYAMLHFCNSRRKEIEKLYGKNTVEETLLQKTLRWEHIYLDLSPEAVKEKYEQEQRLAADKLKQQQGDQQKLRPEANQAESYLPSTKATDVANSNTSAVSEVIKSNTATMTHETLTSPTAVEGLAKPMITGFVISTNAAPTLIDQTMSNPLANPAPKDDSDNATFISRKDTENSEETENSKDAENTKGAEDAENTKDTEDAEFEVITPEEAAQALAKMKQQATSRSSYKGN